MSEVINDDPAIPFNEPAKSYMENFAMMIPKFAVCHFKGCRITNATRDEFVLFISRAQEELVQLIAGDEKLDMWIEKHNDLGRKIKSLNEWFDHWKNPPKKGFEITNDTFHFYRNSQFLRGNMPIVEVYNCFGCGISMSEGELLQFGVLCPVCYKNHKNKSDE